MTTIKLFSDKTIEEIEAYAKLWAEQMPKFSGLSFRLQLINGKFRTIVTERFKENGVVSAAITLDKIVPDAIIESSQESETPDGGWHPTLLDKYAFMLRPEKVNLIAETSVLEALIDCVKQAQTVKELDNQKTLLLFKRCKFSTNERFDKRVHLTQVFKSVKQGHTLNTVNRNQSQLYLRTKVHKGAESDDDL